MWDNFCPNVTPMTQPSKACSEAKQIIIGKRGWVLAFSKYCRTGKESI